MKVEELLKDSGLSLKCRSGKAGLKTEMQTSRVQKTGLLLTGHLEDLLYSDRVQVLGAAEIGYIGSIGKAKTLRALSLFLGTAAGGTHSGRKSAGANVPAIIVTRGLEPPKVLVEFSEEHSIPLLTTPFTSSIFIEKLLASLEEALAPSTLMHGVLVDVLGMGIIVTGKSGIGKSECALDLISRGHRLVADDAILIKRIYPSTLFGMASDRIPYYIEVRGIGIINIKDLFGITSIREKKQVDLVLELVAWNSKEEYDRLGLDEKTCEILGAELPHLRVPVSPGRSVATIVEVAARNQILKIMGYHAGKELMERLEMPYLEAPSEKKRAETAKKRRKKATKAGR